MLQLPDHLKVKIWEDLGVMCASKSEAELSRAALSSSCRAMRESPGILAASGCLELVEEDVLSPTSQLFAPSLPAFGRLLLLGADPCLVQGLFRLLHGRQSTSSHAARQRLGEVVHLQVRPQHAAQRPRAPKPAAHESALCLAPSHSALKHATPRPAHSCCPFPSLPSLQWESSGEVDLLRFENLAQLAVFCPHLGRLQLSLMTLPTSAYDLSALSLLRELRVLELSNCFLEEEPGAEGDDSEPPESPGAPTRSLMQQLGGISSLRDLKLDLRGSDTGYAADVDVTPLAGLSQLRRLDLHNVQLHISSLVHLAAGCPRLVHLELRAVAAAAAAASAAQGPEAAEGGMSDSWGAGGAAAGAAAAAAAVGGWSPAAAEGMVWPALRVLRIVNMEPGHAAAVLQAVGAAPALQRVHPLAVGILAGSEASGPVALQDMAAHAARLGVPVPWLSLSQKTVEPMGLVPIPPFPPSALPPLMSALALFRTGQVERLSVDLAPCPPHAVSVLAAAVPHLTSLSFAEEAGSTGLHAAREAVTSLRFLRYLGIANWGAASEEAVLQLCELAQSLPARQGRALIVSLGGRSHWDQDVDMDASGDDADDESEVEDEVGNGAGHWLRALRDEWAARCERQGLGQPRVELV